ncbi:hypothetical protein HYH02_011711 [Chlamydomonas schloesseri]|uniref:ERD4-related membrane protein n=1 Tax=Chlamydomonas schloesseri TaxID=2026947 RepID=A0A835SZE7_9CHLO|nr:hypothetical protein HYH02_011711 [Chlamydomonas schloesseri]|eukprot:KAG2435998.1 hypothetical protein HYH02_011711 [Chlamydomonas schloesseri]
MPWSSRFFSPRRYAADLELKPARLPHGPFGWVWPVLRYKERDIIDEAGLDCAIYLRIMTYGTYLFVGLSFWCLAAVLPVNLTGGAIDAIMAEQAAANSSSAANGTSSSGSSSQYKFTDFDKYSLSNVAAGSPKLWVHMVSMYAVALFTMALLSRFNRESVLLRLMFLGNAKRGGPSHTVLVTDVPAVREVVAKALRQDRREEKARRKAERRGGATAATGFAIAGGGGGGGSTHTPTTALISEDPDDEEDEAGDGDTGRRSGGTSMAAPSASLAAATTGHGSSRGYSAGGGGGSGLIAFEHDPDQQHPQEGSPMSAALPGRTGAGGSGGWATGGAGGGGTWRSGGGPSGPVAEADEGGGGRRAPDAVEPLLLLREAPSPQRANGWLSSTTPAAAGPAPAAGTSSRANAQSANAVLRLVPEGEGDTRLVSSGPPSHSQQHQQLRPRPSSRDPSSARQHQPQPAAATAAGPTANAANSRGGGGWGGAPAANGAAAGTGGSGTAGGKRADDEQHHQALATQADVASDSSSSSSSRRALNRYQYDLHDKTLDPEWLAREKLQSGLSPAELVQQEFEMVYTHANVAAVNMIKDTSELEPLAEEYKKLMEKLEDYLDMLQLRLKLRQSTPHQQVWVLGAMYGEWGKSYLGTKWFKKVDAVDWWTARLRHLRDRISEEQAKAQRKAAPSAFVTFNTRMSQAVASCSLHAHDVDMWVVRGAPAPFEVVWKNLGMGVAERDSRRLLLWAAFWMMTLFFMIPVAAIQALIEVPKLASVPVLGDIVTAPVIRQILEAIVPGLVLKIFLAIVPIILRFMAILSGAYSLSEVDFGVVKRFFLFQVVVVFFGNIIAGSFFNQLKQWVDNPGSVVPILGKAIPQTATFFITYLFVAGLFVKSLAFLRLPGFVIFWLLSKFAGSPLARRRLWMYQYTDNGTTVVDHCITMLLGLVFCCINPIVCPAALAYFLVTALSERYNNIYVFRRRYESAGKLWGTVFNQVMVGLYIMELTMLGLLAIKKFKWTPLAIPLVVGSALFHVNTLRRYRRPWNVTSLHDAADLDAWEAQHLQSQSKSQSQHTHQQQQPQPHPPASVSAAEEGRALLHAGPVDIPAMTEDEARRVKDTYKNPCFKVDLRRLDELEALAADVRPRLDLLNAWVADLKQAGLSVEEVEQVEQVKGMEQVKKSPAATAAAAGAGGAGPAGLLGEESEGGGGGRMAGSREMAPVRPGGGQGAAASGAEKGDEGAGSSGSGATGCSDDRGREQLVAAGVPAAITAYDDRPDIDAEPSSSRVA